MGCRNRNMYLASGQHSATRCQRSSSRADSWSSTSFPLLTIVRCKTRSHNRCSRPAVSKPDSRNANSVRKAFVP